MPRTHLVGPHMPRGSDWIVMAIRAV